MGEGWQPIPPGEEAAIRAAHLQPGDELVVPVPSRSWRGEALARHRERPAVAAEFAGKLLVAFRRCTRPGERLWVIEWQHAWYCLAPHAAAGEWPYPPLPAGDACYVVASDFRFGFVSGWRATGPVTLFGAELLAAFADDQPMEFLQVCGLGEQRHAEPVAAPDPAT